MFEEGVLFRVRLDVNRQCSQSRWTCRRRRCGQRRLVGARCAVTVICCRWGGDWTQRRAPHVFSEQNKCSKPFLSTSECANFFLYVSYTGSWKTVGSGWACFKSFKGFLVPCVNSRWPVGGVRWTCTGSVLASTSNLLDRTMDPDAGTHPDVSGGDGCWWSVSEGESVCAYGWCSSEKWNPQKKKC